MLLHEGLGSVALWRRFPAQLQAATGRRVIAFSRHGHGRSAPPPRPRTPSFFYEEALEVLPELLRTLRAGEPVLVGHSDGASIALIHAARHPVSALVLLAPHVFVEELTLKSIRRAREEFEHGELRARLARHHDDVDAAFHGWCDVWLDPAFRSWSIEREVERIEAPMLLIQGADDPYGTLSQLERIEARARGPVQRLVLPGGHSLHREHGELVAARVAALLAAAGPDPD
jgi:pimeloyl-ACP methyl ester carboxylesterase